MKYSDYLKNQAQREFQVYDENEKTLYSVLNPLPNKNPIGF